MKRLGKVLVVAMLTVALVGCGGSNDKKSSESEQEKVVTSFIDTLKKGDLASLEDLTSSKYVDQLGVDTIQKSFSAYLDKETYGTTFVDEAQKFINNIFSKFMKDEKVTKSETKDSKTIVTVKGKRMDTSSLNLKMDDEMKELMADYQKENMEELMKIYQESGQDAMQQKIFDDLSTKLFGVFNDRVNKDAKYVDFTLKFTVVKEDGKYLISDIKE